MTDRLSLEAQEAEYQRRLARYRETGDPCDRDAAHAANPRRNDPAWVDVPDWLQIKAELGREY